MTNEWVFFLNIVFLCIILLLFILSLLFYYFVFYFITRLNRDRSFNTAVNKYIFFSFSYFSVTDKIDTWKRFSTVLILCEVNVFRVFTCLNSVHQQHWNSLVNWGFRITTFRVWTQLAFWNGPLMRPMVNQQKYIRLKYLWTRLMSHRLHYFDHI